MGVKTLTQIDLAGGRNSRVQLITCKSNQRFIVKHYFSHRFEKRDRLKVEFSAYRFLHKNGVNSVPFALAQDPKIGVGIYSYIEGEKINPLEASNLDIDQIIEFACKLKQVKKNTVKSFPYNASEACFSTQDLLRNLHTRTNRLLKLPLEKKNYADLNRFLKKEFVPFCQQLSKSITPLTTLKELTTLSPSDFGLHNTLKRPDGGLSFLDFEYFGLDDPAKMISDFLLHPHPLMAFSSHQKQRIFKKFLEGFAEDGTLKQRLKIVYPYYGLKWCLILLNEFIPQEALRRDFARQDKGGLSPKERQQEQLEKTIKMLNKVQLEYINFPYC
jgi:thiamine kinase-like enzyme